MKKKESNKTATTENFKNQTVSDKSREIEIICLEGEDPKIATTRMLIGPHVLNANVAAYFAKSQSGGMIPVASVVTAMTETAKRINANNLQEVEATLISQATAMNIMFTELGRRTALNMGENLDASERYFRMALKAQNQCRMTLETLSNIKNPPVIYAKQANITNGPQQVNNHAHADEIKNQPNKILENTHDERMDGGTKSQASDCHSALEALDAGDGS
jgi:hypothetical protein